MSGIKFHLWLFSNLCIMFGIQYSRCLRTHACIRVCVHACLGVGGGRVLVVI